MKNPMIDRHYHVRPDQDEDLKILASRLRVKPAQLVRQGIDLIIEKHALSENWVEETRQIRGLLNYDTDIDERILKARKSMDRVFEISD